jgi:hypothetical protein
MCGASLERLFRLNRMVIAPISLLASNGAQVDAI